MNKRRNVLIWLMVLALTFALSACGTDGNSVESSSGSESGVSDTVEAAEPGKISSEETDAVTQENDEANQESDLTESNVLVAYFSHTGNTEEVAQRIAEYTGGDLTEIQRAEEYGDLNEEAEEEILEGVYPEITVSVDSVEDYNTIFVGYPIWWDEAPAMIGTFLSNYDFEGKTIIPFCTSSSDEIDNSLHIFSELCPDAEMAGGLTANDLNDIEPWLQNLGFVR